MLSYCLRIVPIFIDFSAHDEILMPLDSVDDTKVAEWFDGKIVAFLDTYLCLETHRQYQTANIVTDPDCGMPVNKLHAAATLDHCGLTYYFCVEGCRKKFADDPDQYITGKKASR